MSKHVPQYRHIKLSGEGLAHIMAENGLSDDDFMFLTGVGRRTLQKWKHSTTDEDAPPHWIRVLLALTSHEDGLEHAFAVSDRVHVAEQRYRRHRDAKRRESARHP